MNDVEITSSMSAVPTEIRSQLDEAENTSFPVERRLIHLKKAEQMILGSGPGSSLLDNFFDEVLRFMDYGHEDPRFQLFVVSFVEKACRQDCEMLEKAANILRTTFDDQNTAVSVRKKIINLMFLVYPLIFNWAASHKNDRSAESTWDVMKVLKYRILQCTDSDNQGICSMALKFLQTVILSQTTQTQHSEAPRHKGQIMSLDKLSRDHKFISYHKMDTEAGLDFDNLISRMLSTHIPCINLLTCIGCICEIARQRPGFMQKVISALERLQFNLPPTLSTSQVKSVRKEMKMHLLRMLKHPASTQFHQVITTLLSDVGASQGEISRALPNGSSGRRALTRPSSSNNVAQSSGYEEPQSKRPKLPPVEDDEYADEKPNQSNVCSDGSSGKAIDITARFIYERLSPKVVTNLVLISLVTLPDEMPPAFASSYTPISAAGTEGQRHHLARIMATQFTSAGVGPGVEQMKKEQKEEFFARQQARSDGAVIPPTPQHIAAAMTPKPEASAKPPPPVQFSVPQVPVQKPKGKIQFNLITSVQDMSDEEAKKLMSQAFERIMSNERRAIQGGEGVAHQMLLVRIVTRFASPLISEFEKSLLDFILADQRSRTEIALLWIAELFAQYQGHSIVRHDLHEPFEFTKEERRTRYDIVVTGMLSALYEGGHHKELLFHKILLEAPLVTEAMLKWLRIACIDEVFGSFGMTTLRELILTRSRQRDELLSLLFNFSYSQNQELRSQSIETAKELYMISYIKQDVQRFASDMVQLCTQPAAPLPIVANYFGDEYVEKLQAEERSEPWSEALIKSALCLFFALMPLEHSLIKTLADVYSKANNDVKRVVLKSVEPAAKSIGMGSPDLLDMIEHCPEGTQTLVAKIVNLLTERSQPTPEIVSRMMFLYVKRKTDVRSLIPVLTRLSKEELFDLLPKFVLSSAVQRSVPAVFSKILSAKKEDTDELTVPPLELLLTIHRLPTSSDKERKLLASNIKTLLQSKLMSKETIANGIEALLDDKPIKKILFDTILAVYENPAMSNLRGFLANVVSRIVSAKMWDDPESECDWSFFVSFARTVSNAACAAVLTGFTSEELTEYLECENRNNLIIELRDYYHNLSRNQKRLVKDGVLECIQSEAERIESASPRLLLPFGGVPSPLEMRLLFLLGFCVFGAFGTTCPQQCECFAEQRRVDCRKRGLSRVPEGIPRDTVTLDLRDNQIRHLSARGLRGLPKLETLIAAHNRIHKIDMDLLDALPALNRLYLGRNRVSEVEALASRDHHLHTLDLHANRISRISEGALRYLRSLRRVELRHNLLQTIDAAAVDALQKTKELGLEKNQLNCDCRLTHLHLLLASKASNASEALCWNPPHLRGREVASLEKVNFECLIAEAVETPNGHVVSCKTEFHNDVHWIFEGAFLKEDADDIELLGNGSLLVRDEEFDVDDFRCAVEYPLRAAKKVRRALPQRGEPQFTLAPRDRTFREGASVKLNCEAVGNPRPFIQWFFKGRAIEESLKHEYSQHNSQLVIYPFLKHDEGGYSCVASNQFGRKEARFQLRMTPSSSPRIVDAPISQSTKPGSHVTFRCRAVGSPKPRITWFFNGVEIANLKGHFQVSDDETELTIGHVTRQDHGAYSCMAGNDVGAMTSEFRLSVEIANQNAIDQSLNDRLLKQIVHEAERNVDRAIQNTKAEIRSAKVTSPHDLMRLFKFAVPRTSDLTRSREVYEESLRLIQKHVQQGLRLPTHELPTNVSYESVLSVSHIQTLMELSGCQAGVFKDPCTNMCFHSKYRSYDGQCNNFDHPMRGVSQMPLIRLLPPVYENGFNTPLGWDPTRLYNGFRLPNPRTVSRRLIGTEDITPHHRFSSMLMQWGQFVDHDLDHTSMALARQTYSTGAICNRTCENLDPCFNIPLPPDDPRLRHPERVKYPCIEFERSAAVCGSGETSLIFQQVTHREQMNLITSYLDASGIYGSTEVDALDLRDLFGDHGLLRFDIVSASQKPYLPFERDSPMDCRRNRSVDNPIRCFLAGDFRANEQLGLAAMHTLWLREHNRVATKLLEMNPDWDGERIYQESRKIVGAQIQHITYTHWLPKVLGEEGFRQRVGPYRGYDPEVDATISNAFATAAFRFGHTLINPKLMRMDKEFRTILQGDIPLHEAFFAPERLLSEGGVDPLLRGLFASPLKKPESHQLLNMELTEKLFKKAVDVSLDLAGVNIQRARDHGLPGYMAYRKWCNLTVAETWEQLAVDIPDAGVRQKLRELYGHPANIELWVGGITEKKLPDALVGPTFSCIIADQFRRLRDGDRFWYENEGVFSQLQLQQIRKTSLGKVLCNNGDDIDRVQKDVFLFVGNNTKQYKECAALEDVNLKMWMSCCDASCAARVDGGLSEAQKRKRRTLRRYSGPEEKCHFDGKEFEHLEQWSVGRCVVCECRNTKVWCTTNTDCGKE
ncbi:hypothetical protein QR680_005736 [Steinernema hermaphroditum]|uniref:Ig-like domain-containing protein n=1 Tax=Steinernema hermaphroditum TaxID=289476 RepID=A0AA39HVC2_9BILA|nr:hypothetical protein QR680_005736 [Steinernema hermaphroditum]